MAIGSMKSWPGIQLLIDVAVTAVETACAAYTNLVQRTIALSYRNYQ